MMSPALLDAPTVDRAYMVAPGIGHLRITSFEEPTGQLVKQTIEKLGGKSLKGLIIDLRDNPGGAVQSAAETAALFLSPDQLIFTIGGRSTKTEASGRSQGFDALHFSDGDSGQRKERQRFRDRHRRAAGSRSRRRAGRAELRQGSGAAGLSAIGVQRPGAHHGVLLHAQRPLHSETAGERSIGRGDGGRPRTVPLRRRPFAARRRRHPAG